ncbi:DUF4253 domain-containing protein [Planctomycetota bacterium]|nr:DUF4253 domain-containing protein [Planctomycetota bacterium]
MKIIELDSSTVIDQAIQSANTEQKLIILGNPQNMEDFQGVINDPSKDVNAILQEASNIDPQQWFEQQGYEDGIVDEWPDYLEFPNDPTQLDFSIHKETLTGKLLANLVGVQITTTHSYQAFAHLNFGGWNDCPNPEIHCAIWKMWEEKYGAKVIAIGVDTVEAYIQSPPKTPEQANELAAQQYMYCTDIVEQGCESVEVLAAGLLNNNQWFFWWD